MPFFRVDLDVRTDPRWAACPEPLRAAAKALYLDAVSYSAELLTDGHVPTSVLAGLAAELGIKRPRRVIDFLLGSGHEKAVSPSQTTPEPGQKTSVFSPRNAHLSRTKTGYLIVGWEHFYDSREKVQQRRESAAERKRTSRQQLQMPSTGAMSQRDVTAESQRDMGRDSRAHARTREAEAEQVPKAAAVLDPGSPAAAELEQRLRTIGITDRRLVATAIADPQRATAWLDKATVAATSNVAGYVRHGLESHDWPTSNGSHTAPADPAERRERYVRGDGHLLPDDELEYQLRRMGADDDECIGLTELAADLRS